jgi:hypothetical protein
LPERILRVDEHDPPGSTGNRNGVLDPGETVSVVPSWVNPTGGPISVTGVASSFAGPPPGVYTVPDPLADYGAIPGSQATANCFDTTGDCYLLGVSRTSRPFHWDTTFDETLSNGDVATWTIHVGESFPDIAPDHPFYRFAETVCHNRVFSCGELLLPDIPVWRDEMAVFLLTSCFGPSYVPPDPTGTVFGDVPAEDLRYAPFIEDLAARGITAGCGNGLYCPHDEITREQIAVFLLRTLEGPTYLPPDCATPVFSDVPCSSSFARWVEELARRGITAGCGAGFYCPAEPVTHGQIAVFLTTTFGLRLNGP